MCTAVGKAADLSLKLTEAKTKKSPCNVSTPFMKNHRFCEDDRRGDKARLHRFRVPGGDSTNVLENLNRKTRGYSQIGGAFTTSGIACAKKPLQL